MRQRLLLPLFALLCSAGSTSAQTYTEKVQAYIARYKDLAMAEQQRIGIPASITLAQGILETQAGSSELSTAANNHFGIKCKKDWTGETMTHDDDAPNECFRKYPSAYDSYKDHSDYLKSNPRYASCWQQSITDYAAWASHLKKCGYATNPKYAPQLIRIIEENHLQQYTYAAIDKNDPMDNVATTTPEKTPAVASAAAVAAMTSQSPAAPAELPAKLWDAAVHNGTRGFWARKGDVLLEAAIRHKVRYARLLQLNNLPDAPLADDRFVYLEKAPVVVRTLAPAAPAPPVTPQAPAPVATARAETAPAPPQPAVPVPPMMADASPAPAAYTRLAPSEVATTATAPQPPAAPAVQDVPVNLADEPAIEEMDGTEEEVPAPTTPQGQPVSDFNGLKARLDKMVYATPSATSAAPAATPTASLPVAVKAATPAPSKITTAAPAAGADFHTVQAGETAYAISRKYKIGVQELMRLNNMNNFDAIRTGQKLRVK